MPVATDAEGGSLSHLLADPESADAQARTTMEQLVRHELDRLSDQSRLPLVLKYLNGLTNQQIADALGISLSNVKVRLARAKDLLAGRLERILEG